MKSTLKRGFKEREIAERETFGTIVVVRGCGRVATCQSQLVDYTTAMGASGQKVACALPIKW